MSTIEPTYEDPTVGGEAIARDRVRELLGPVIGFVAVALGFAAPLTAALREAEQRLRSPQRRRRGSRAGSPRHLTGLEPVSRQAVVGGRRVGVRSLHRLDSAPAFVGR